MPSFLWTSTGIPLPLSFTVTEPSLFTMMLISEQCPAMASSIQLSKTSKTM